MVNRKTNFFVVGLPRSRTAFMANFLTHDGNHCYHEAVNGCSTMAEYKAKLGNFTGDSSTALMMMNISEHFPDSKIIRIYGNLEQSIRSSKRIYPELDREELDEWICGLAEQLGEMNDLNCYNIHIDNLDSHLDSIWNWLFQTPVDRERLDMLLNMRIEMLDPHSFDEEALEAFFNPNKNNLEL